MRGNRTVAGRASKRPLVPLISTSSVRLGYRDRMPQWSPEVDLDASRARSLIGVQFEELADADVQLVAAGWDNTAFLVDGRWIFRFPRREVAVPLLAREIEILPRIAPNLPLAVPEPRWIGAPSDGYPWPWFGAPALPGRELAAVELSDARRGELAAAVGRFLADLHAPALRSRIGPTLPLDPNRRSDMAFRVEATRRRLDELAEAGLWQAPPEVEALLADAARLPPSPRIAVLHGDLHARHLLVGADGRATGVIDWGDVCVGDPAIDLSVAYGAFVGPARTALFEAYARPIDGLAELRARVVAVWLAATLLAYADDVGLDELRTEAARSLGRAVA
jgi:aminoglycoside phosphotransferase (APT) family kinase protein